MQERNNGLWILNYQYIRRILNISIGCGEKVIGPCWEWDIRGKIWKDKRWLWESGMLDVELMGELLLLVMRR